MCTSGEPLFWLGSYNLKTFVAGEIKRMSSCWRGTQFQKVPQNPLTRPVLNARPETLKVTAPVGRGSVLFAVKLQSLRSGAVPQEVSVSGLRSLPCRSAERQQVLSLSLLGALALFRGIGTSKTLSSRVQAQCDSLTCGRVSPLFLPQQVATKETLKTWFDTEEHEKTQNLATCER